jgi:hypothetical protein
VLLVGTSRTLSYGDGIDNDQDGSIDEEVANGVDDDGDWDITAGDDRHTSILLLNDERPGGAAAADWGDARVDEDVLFSSDTLRYHTEATSTSYDYDEVSYAIGTHNGIDHVLVRKVVEWSGATSTTKSTSGLAYGVLSFNCMFYHSNVDATSQTWTHSWDSAAPPNPGGYAPPFDLPAAIALEVVTYADDRPIDTVDLGVDKIKTMTLRTVVTVESVINDANFDQH